MAIGQMHDVKDYAPVGYRLERSDYADGGVSHLFVADGRPDLVCKVSAHEDEKAVLTSFRVGHLAPPNSSVVPNSSLEPDPGSELPYDGEGEAL
jgi:hypothetical protein